MANKINHQMYLYNMRNILLTITLAIFLVACENHTTHNTYNNECKCEQCGSSCTSPSDTLSGPTEEPEALTEEPVITEEGEQ
jgi:hypothetical protein